MTEVFGRRQEPDRAFENGTPYKTKYAEPGLSFWRELTGFILLSISLVFMVPVYLLNKLTTRICGGSQ